MESSIAKQKRYQYQTKQNEKYCKYCGKQLTRKRFNGRMEDFGVFCKRLYCDRECMRRDYLKVGFNDQSYNTAHQTAHSINKLILKKDKCDICGKKENLDIHHKDKNWKNNNLENLMCLCRSCHLKQHREKQTCKICGKPMKGLGYCNKHYLRYKKYGDPLKTKNKVGREML